MEVWELFQIIQEYGKITHTNQSNHCKMLLVLLKRKIVYGRDAITTLRVPFDRMNVYFQDAGFSVYEIRSFYDVISNIIDFAYPQPVYPPPEALPQMSQFSLGVTLGSVCVAIGCFVAYTISRSTSNDL